MVHQTITSTESGRWARMRSILWREFRQVLPPTIFFLIGFNLILFTKRLILAEYLIQFTGFFVATTAALVVGKVVLVVDKMPFLRRFDYAPLAQPILFKSCIYTFFVLVARLLEAFVHYLIKGGVVGHGGFLEHLIGSFSWHQFVATQLWIFVLFLIYVTGSELNELVGDGELFKIFFKRRSTELKSTRRSRIRLLVQLSKLTDAHSIRELRDPATTSNAELVTILTKLAQKGHST